MCYVEDCGCISKLLPVEICDTDDIIIVDLLGLTDALSKGKVYVVFVTYFLCIFAYYNAYKHVVIQ